MSSPPYTNVSPPIEDFLVKVLYQYLAKCDNPRSIPKLSEVSSLNYHQGLFLTIVIYVFNDCLPVALVQIPKPHDFNQITCNPIAELVHTDSDDLPNPSVVSPCQYHDIASFNSLSAKLNWPGFSILHANARSLKKNLEPLTILLSEANHPPHFTAISETKINKDTGLNFVPNIPGYSFAHSDTQYAAGGAAIYTRQYLICGTP